eukprot:TRINITY_DN5482_c0_g1_i2.p1 TRINITY_DN5482_c0_g1~~TRINITY_DN5482_c0_g1_i2.p1  ORF type:complete len:262 (+),score=35.08 TRINITY_DN5482_c0_g1_i2:56-841(+)
MSGLLLYVRTCCGRTLPIDLPPDATWGDLEGAALQAGCGGFLTYGGAEHSTEALLSDIGVGQESAVHEVTKRQCWTELGTGIVRYDIGRASTAPVRRVRALASKQREGRVCLGRTIPPGGASAWRIKMFLVEGRRESANRSTGVTASEDLECTGSVPSDSVAFCEGKISTKLGTKYHPGPDHTCQWRSDTMLCFVLQERTLYIGQKLEEREVRWLCAHSGIDVPVRPYFSFCRWCTDVVKIVGGEDLVVPQNWREEVESAP